MTAEKIFFSYSRTDSTFVLKLAKDLRDKGITLWLDQLDIKAGSHWDTSIQDALVATRILIVVLSKASVKSENVMDEVSFALEQDKTILPVIINDCTPPFRLMRLQRLDFTGDYQTGLNQLMEAINAISASNAIPETDPGAEKVTLTERRDTPPAETDRKKEVEKQPEVTVAGNTGGALNEPTSKSSSKKFLLLLGGLLIIAATVWGVMQYSGNSGKTIDEISQQRDDSIRLANARKVTEDSMNNLKQAALAKARKDSIKIGNEFQGGVIYFIDASGEHGLIMAQGDQHDKLRWHYGPIEKAGAFGKRIYSGRKNTNLIVGKLGEGTYPAKICADLVIEGYDDWYLPSIDELDELYKFSKKNKGFTDDYYWSSTELSADDVYYKSFYNGQSFTKFGRNMAKVRAIRSF